MGDRNAPRDMPSLVWVEHAYADARKIHLDVSLHPYAARQEFGPAVEGQGRIECNVSPAHHLLRLL